jgi:DMSO/TMAO reductase YedYZ molybdopterin-dependent catalytic subunit
MSLYGLSRRALLTGGVATFSGLMLAGCDRLSQAPKFQAFLDNAEGLDMRVQRFLLSGGQLAREFRPDQMSPVFRSNGSADANDNTDYVVMQQNGFADYRLTVDGLVSRPLSLSLADLKSLPQRTQITRHDCVEGWSAIGQWTGPQLALVLKAAGLKPNARFAVFHCFDDPEESGDMDARYYESIDLIDAFHPQTILAHSMNGQPLAVEHGAPVRMRIERQLGYKQAKFVSRIEIVDSFAKMAGGKGGYWEDRGYAWYAGI